MEQAQLTGSYASVSGGDILRILWRRLWVIALVMAVSIGTASYVSNHTPKRWQANAQLILVQRAPSMFAQDGYAAPLVESADTQVALLQNYAMARRVITRLNKGYSTDAIGITAEELQKSLVVSTAKNANLIDVFVEADSREKAEKLANAVCETFEEFKKGVATKNVQETLDSLEERASRARSQMVQAERAEVAFKRNHNKPDVPSFHKEAVEQYLHQDTEVATQKQALSAEEDHVKALGERLDRENKTIRVATSLRDDAEVLKLQSQLKELEIERASKALVYRPSFPGVLPVLDAQIKELQEKLAKEIQGTLDNTRPSIQSQGALFDEYKKAEITLRFDRAKFDAAVNLRDRLQAELKGIPQENMEYARLERDADSARKLYSSLQTALSSARINKDMATGNVQTVQEAFAPETPIRPNRTRDLLFGGAVGLLLSLVAVLLMEQSDRRVRTLDSVRRLVPGPVIGALPKMSRSQIQRMLHGETPPEAIEAYSLARANLTLAARSAVQGGARQQIILITSAVPNEGKSVTAAELARSMARTGQRVILVDADMRRPSQNRLFRTAEPHGLAEVLAGEMTLDDVLVSSDTENLLILHSGESSRNPTEMISQPQMAQTLEALRNEAEYVIVDAPACSAVADALLLASHVDCIFYVIGAGQVDEDLVRETTTALSAAKPETMVFFVNRAPNDRSRAYKSYYYYSNGKSRTVSRSASVATEPISVAKEPLPVVYEPTLELPRLEPAEAEKHADDTRQG